MNLVISKAKIEDADKICAIWKVICSERIYTAIDKPFTLKQERDYLSGLSEREGVFLAILDGKTVGFQTIDLWAKYTDSFSHVGHLGTYILPENRRQGIATQLAEHNINWARNHRYEKLVIYVRDTNKPGQAFYKKLGFKTIGKLKNQVKIDGKYEDEIVMELFL